MERRLDAGNTTDGDAPAFLDPRYLQQTSQRRRREMGFELLRRVLGRVNYERVRSWRRHGRWPDLRSPSRFNEKVSFRKLYEDIPNAPTIVDKVAVRDYVASIVGKQYLKDVLQVHEDPADIRFDLLPERFVAKTNQASTLNLFVPRKSDADLDAVRQQLRVLLRRRVGRLKNEWWYDKIPPRVLIEPYLDLAADYRLWVFHGRVEHIRATHPATAGSIAYDRDWRLVDLDRPVRQEFPRPPRLDEMMEVAEALSAGFDFLRIDLFSPGDRNVVFGELTLAPGSGWSRRSDKEDITLGNLW